MEFFVFCDMEVKIMIKHMKNVLWNYEHRLEIKFDLFFIQLIRITQMMMIKII
jgi:hypothetical protein